MEELLQYVHKYSHCTHCAQTKGHIQNMLLRRLGVNMSEQQLD